MSNKFGVNTFIKEVHIQSVDFNETYKLPDYRFVIEIVEISTHNGNGVKEMKIYTEGKLLELNSGNWKISPIVRLPYDWSGYRPEIETIDKGMDVHKHECRIGEDVYHTRDYEVIIKWAFDTIRELEKVENVKHLKLLDFIYETNRLLNIYKKGGTDIQNIKKLIESLEHEQRELKELKNELSDEGFQSTRLKVNANIDTFNEVKLKTIADNY